MTAAIKKALIGCGAAVVLVAAAAVATCAVGFWWLQRGGRVVQRTELVGPETQAFVTFIAASEDRALLDLFGTVERRASARKDGPPDWLHSLADFLSAAKVSHEGGGAASLFPLRGTVMVEKPEGADGQVIYVVSLGKHANLIRMFLGISDSERETETYRGEKVLIGRGGHDLSMALVQNNLLLSGDKRAIKLLIDRVKASGGASRPSAALFACIQGVDPGGEMPGFGGIVNDRKSIATVWQLGTGAPAGSEVALPDEFEGVGFRFGIASADSLRGDGYFYFTDEEAAAGASEALKSALMRLLSHYGLRPEISLRQEGSRLAVAVEAKGVQVALDGFFTHLQSPPPAR